MWPFYAYWFWCIINQLDLKKENAAPIKLVIHEKQHNFHFINFVQHDVDRITKSKEKYSLSFL